VQEYKLERELNRKEKEAKKLEGETKPAPEPKFSDYTIQQPAKPEQPVAKKPKPEPKPEKEASVLGSTTAASGQQFVLPTLDLLEQPPALAARNVMDDLKTSAQVLRDTVREFGIEVESGDVTKGPTVTLFELHPAPGVRVETLSALCSKLALAM